MGPLLRVSTDQNRSISELTFLLQLRWRNMCSKPNTELGRYGEAEDERRWLCRRSERRMGHQKLVSELQGWEHFGRFPQS